MWPTSSDIQPRISHFNLQCRGWRSGSDYVSALLNLCDFCFVQEYWLLLDHLSALDISDDFISVGVSGMDSSDLLAGRPYGGCAILYHKSLSRSIHGLNAALSVFVLFF